MKTAGYMLCLMTLILSCILEPYEVVNEKGYCYPGNKEFLKLCEKEKAIITPMDSLPDTLFIDSAEQTFSFAYRYSVDPAFFEYGSYNFEVQRPSYFEYIASGDNDTAGWGIWSFYDEVIVHDSSRITPVTHETDTVSIVFTYKASEASRLPDSYQHSYDGIMDGTVFTLSFYLNRYVNDDYCSSEIIYESDPFIAIIRNMYE